MNQKGKVKYQDLTPNPPTNPPKSLQIPILKNDSINCEGKCEADNHLQLYYEADDWVTIERNMLVNYQIMQNGDKREFILLMTPIYGGKEWLSGFIIK